MTDQDSASSRQTGPESTAAAQVGGVSSEELAWTSHPVRRKPRAAVLTAVLIVVCVAAVRAAMDSDAFAVLAGVVLVLSVAKFYLPTSYRLTPEQIVIKTMTQTLSKSWAQYRSCYPDKNGILLSPFPVPSRLENFRGLYILFDRNGEEVTAYVRKYIGTKPHRDEAEVKP